MKKLILIITCLMLASCEWLFGAGVQADFYENEAGDLLVCIEGTTPPAGEWRSVGSGKTTLTPVDCDDL